MGVSQHFAIYAIVVPLFAAAIIPIVTQWKRNWVMPLACLALATSLTLSALLIPKLLASGYLSYHLGSWEPPFGIEIRLDFLGILMMTLISAVCLVVVIYSKRYIRFEVDAKELAMGQADGTGIPIRGIRKRGKELKVFVQLKRTGGIRIAGLAIGNYEGEWEKLFEPLLEGLRKFKQFFLVTDGDTNILKSLGDRVKVVFQEISDVLGQIVFARP